MKYIFQDQEPASAKTLDDFNADPSFDRRGTFVGTAYYVSPEMLKLNQATAASDIWALGCIIYKMLTGREPFSGTTDYFTFQMILERQLSFKPEDTGVSDVARDLIDKLLQLDPHERLGAGPVGSDRDYRALKKHPFFNGVKFHEVYKMQVPLAKRYPVEELPIRKGGAAESVVELRPAVDGQEVRMVHQGHLKKRNPYFMNQDRFFKLFSDGKIEYYNEKNIMRGTLYLSTKSKIVKTAKDKFEIHNHDRTYFLTESDTEKLSSGAWIDRLEEVISKLK